jgi:hypothetical protein
MSAGGRAKSKCICLQDISTFYNFFAMQVVDGYCCCPFQHFCKSGGEFLKSNWILNLGENK